MTQCQIAETGAAYSRSPLQLASFKSSVKTKVSSIGPNNWRSVCSLSMEMPWSAASRPVSTKCSLGVLVRRFNWLEYQGFSLWIKKSCSRMPRYFRVRVWLISKGHRCRSSWQADRYSGKPFAVRHEAVGFYQFVRYPWRHDGSGHLCSWDARSGVENWKTTNWNLHNDQLKVKHWRIESC